MAEKDVVTKLSDIITEQAEVAVANYFADNAMLAYDLNYAECTLIMPDGELIINVGIDYDCDMIPTKSKPQEVVRTKIGSFDEFTWQMLCDIKKEHNPVKICFEHIEEYLHFIMMKLGFSEKDLSKKTINAELMDEYHIQEYYVHENYSGRGMLGRKCLGIVVRQGKYSACSESSQKSI